MMRKLIRARKNTYKELNLISNSFESIYLIRVKAVYINANPGIHVKETYDIATFYDYNDALKCVDLTAKKYMEGIHVNEKFRIIMDDVLPKDKATANNILVEYARIIKIQGVLNESETGLFTFEIEKLPYSNYSGKYDN